MVRTSVHTCKDCNKLYASYQSLCNHRSKKHDNSYNSISQHTQQHVTAFNNIHIKQFNCRKCNKSYKHQQSRSRHELKCDIITKPETIIENNGTINNTTNTNNTNNGTINNIVINNYGQESTSYVSDKFMLNRLSELLKYDDESLKNFIAYLIENIHLNPNRKENNNIQFNNLKSPVAKKFINDKWVYVDKDELIEELHNNKVDLTEKWIDDNKDKVPKQSKDKIKDYKKIPKTYKKKNIYPEINKRGYIYYKNHIEDELDS